MVVGQVLLALGAATLAVGQPDPRFNLFFQAPGQIGDDYSSMPNALVIGKSFIVLAADVASLTSCFREWTTGGGNVWTTGKRGPHH